MILSRGRKYLFVHIPKTGGTALAQALEARAMADDLLVGDTPKARKRRGRLRDVKTAGRLWKHSTLAEAEGLYHRDELDDLYIFTLVRNPWDRTVSYYHWLRAQSFDHPAVTTAKAHDFSGFLHDPSMQASLQAHPYSWYLRDGAGVQRPAHYIRLEHFAKDAAALEAHLGFALTPLPKVNVSDRPRDYRRFYSDEDAALLGRLNRANCAQFGYEFDRSYI